MYSNNNASPTRKGKLVVSNKNKKKRRKKKSYLKKKRMMSPVAIILALVTLVFMGGAVGVWAWYNSFTEIKLSDYSQISLSGYNNYGVAAVDMLGDSEYAEFFKTANAYLDKTGSLHNGDEITVSYTFDEQTAKDNHLRVDATENSIIVEGLPDATVINKEYLFSAAEITYEGMSPCLFASVANNSTDEFLSQVVYKLGEDRKVFYESGDSFLVTAEFPEEYYSNPAYVIEIGETDLVNEYIIPDGKSYYTQSYQVSDEMLDQLEKAGLEIISRADAKEYGLRIFQHEAHLKPVFVGNTTTFKWVNPYMISAYFHAITAEGKKSIDNHANDVQIVYAVTLTQQDGTSCLCEMVIQFSNLCDNEDGTPNLNLDSGRIISASYRDSNVKKLVTGGSDGAYETTKLTE